MAFVGGLAVRGGGVQVRERDGRRVEENGLWIVRDRRSGDGNVGVVVGRVRRGARLGTQQRRKCCESDEMQGENVMNSGKGPATKAQHKEGSEDGEDSDGLENRPGQVSDADELDRLREQIAVLELSLDAAVHTQQFQEAAALRDRLKKLRGRDPYWAIQTELQEAIDTENYKLAAELRDRLSRVPVPSSSLSKPASAGSGPATTDTSRSESSKPPAIPNTVTAVSDTVSSGIRVRVTSKYMPEQSKPARNYYVFSYKVKITNESCPKGMVQLVRRHWKIVDLGGHLSEVKGPGVVGAQPVLDKGESFEYESMCPFQLKVGEGSSNVSNSQLTRARAGAEAIGAMSGSYLMVGGALGNEGFDVDVDQFGFFLPSS